MNSEQHGRLLSQVGLRKLLQESPGFLEFRDHCHRYARQLYLHLVATGGKTEQERIELLAQARLMSELFESFDLDTHTMEQVLDQQRMQDDAEYREHMKAGTMKGRAKSMRSAINTEAVLSQFFASQGAEE